MHKVASDNCPFSHRSKLEPAMPSPTLPTTSQSISVFGGGDWEGPFVSHRANNQSRDTDSCTWVCESQFCLIPRVTCQDAEEQSAITGFGRGERKNLAIRLGAMSSDAGSFQFDHGRNAQQHTASNEIGRSVGRYSKVSRFSKVSSRGSARARSGVEDLKGDTSLDMLELNVPERQRQCGSAGKNCRTLVMCHRCNVAIWVEWFRMSPLCPFGSNMT